MSRGLKDDDIEIYLSSLEDCEPTFDAYASEDDCETDEDEYASTSNLLAVLGSSSESENLPSNTLVEVASTSSSNYDGNISEPSAEQSLQTIRLEEQMTTDSDYETDPSDDDEDEWTKRGWPVQPDLTYFDSRPLRAAWLFPSRSNPLSYFSKFFTEEVFTLIVEQFVCKPKQIACMDAYK